ncbi:MAG: holo-ACP synthase [Sulfurovum sp.]|nr:holo-ACP synthase [Sulfurovum sp.]
MHIGTDIIQINRIKKIDDKYNLHFKKKFLSDDEITLIKKIETLAGFWAAKEAISKALGCGIGSELSFHDIHLSKSDKGAPSFVLSVAAQNKHKIKSASLSISHDGGFAIAVVAIVKNN